MVKGFRMRWLGFILLFLSIYAATTSSAFASDKASLVDIYCQFVTLKLGTTQPTAITKEQWGTLIAHFQKRLPFVANNEISDSISAQIDLCRVQNQERLTRAEYLLDGVESLSQNLHAVQQSVDVAPALLTVSIPLHERQLSTPEGLITIDEDADMPSAREVAEGLKERTERYEAMWQSLLNEIHQNLTGRVTTF